MTVGIDRQLSRRLEFLLKRLSKYNLFCKFGDVHLANDTKRNKKMPLLRRFVGMSLSLYSTRWRRFNHRGESSSDRFSVNLCALRGSSRALFFSDGNFDRLISVLRYGNIDLQKTLKDIDMSQAVLRQRTGAETAALPCSISSDCHWEQ